VPAGQGLRAADDATPELTDATPELTWWAMCCPAPRTAPLFATQSTLGVLLAELTLPTGHAWQLEALL